MNLKTKTPGANRAGETTRHLKSIKPAGENQKLLPHCKESEKNLLAALMVDRGKIGEVSAFLCAADFYGTVSRKIYARIVEWRKKGKLFSPSILSESFIDAPDFENLGFGIMDLMPEMKYPTGEGAIYFAVIVKNLADLRRMIVIGDTFFTCCDNPSLDPDEEIAKASAAIHEMKASRDFIPTRYRGVA